MLLSGPLSLVSLLLMTDRVRRNGRNGSFQRRAGISALWAALLFLPGHARAEGMSQAQQKPKPLEKEAEKDPFAGLEPAKTGAPELSSGKDAGALGRLTGRNFSLKTELFSQFTTGRPVEADPPLYSRQSLGFELLKKFSTATATVAAFNAQFRLVRRDNYIDATNDMEGAERAGFYPEYHNAYLDLYNVFNPLMGASARSRHVGRFNWRTGRLYLPFGINLQSDTHGTLLQLSNEKDLGFERDWYTGLYGSLNRHLNYDLYYLLGSGYYPRFRGQSGLLGARLSLGNRFLNEHGLEGGVSFLGGERFSPHSAERSHSVAEAARGTRIVRTLRFGLDGRYTRPLWKGTAVVTTELSAGKDRPDPVFGNLHQFEYLARSRRWGWAAQYRRFWQDSAAAGHSAGSGKADASLIGEVSLYFRNDPSASRLHWIKLNVERRLERMKEETAWLFTIQYYFYR